MILDAPAVLTGKHQRDDKSEVGDEAAVPADGIPIVPADLLCLTVGGPQLELAGVRGAAPHAVDGDVVVYDAAKLLHVVDGIVATQAGLFGEFPIGTLDGCFTGFDLAPWQIEFAFLPFRLVLLYKKEVLI